MTIDPTLYPVGSRLSAVICVVCAICGQVLQNAEDLFLRTLTKFSSEFRMHR